MDTRRAESFSDGVFAVAITVLVFDLLPIGADLVKGPELAHALRTAWPQYAAYAISFLTIGIMWLNHHVMVAHLRRIDQVLLVLNLLLLMGIVALPFPTALVARELAPDAHADALRVATVTYGLVMVFISVVFGGMWFDLTSHQEQLVRGGRMDLPRWARLRFTGGLWGYVAGILVALFISPAAGLVIYALLAVYYIFRNLPEPATGEADQVPAQPPSGL
jgi:uncharacterized membrane protein